MAILKVLSCHPEGAATIVALNADLAILNTSGKDWTDRMRRLSACIPDLNLFGQGLVVRSASGWQITDAGRAVLLAAENRSRAPQEDTPVTASEANPDPSAAALPADRPRPAIELAGRTMRRRHRRARAALSRSA